MFSETDISTTILLLILVIQTITIVVISFFVYKSSRSISKTLDEINDVMILIRPNAEEAFESAREIMDSLQKASFHVKNIADELEGSFENVRETTEDVFGVFRDTAVRAEHHVKRVDHLFTEAIDRTEETTEYVTHTVYPQIVELAALAKGVYTSIEYLRRKRRFPTAAFTRR